VCIKFIFRVLDMTHDKIRTDYTCQTVEGPDSELGSAKFSYGGSDLKG
jgi:hypothetical protein